MKKAPVMKPVEFDEAKKFPLNDESRHCEYGNASEDEWQQIQSKKIHTTSLTTNFLSTSAATRKAIPYTMY